MSFWDKLTPRDVIGIFVLGFTLTLTAMGINHVVSGVTIAVVSYYFGRRKDYESQQ